MSAMPVEEIPFTFGPLSGRRDRLSVVSDDTETRGGGGGYPCICGCGPGQPLPPTEQFDAHTPEEQARHLAWLDTKTPAERRHYERYLAGAEFHPFPWFSVTRPAGGRRHRQPGPVEYGGGRTR